MLADFDQRISGLQLNPLRIGLFAEPRHLSLGKLPGFAFHQLNCFRQGTFASQVLDHLPVTDGLHGGFVLREAMVEAPPSFNY